MGQQRSAASRVNSPGSVCLRGRGLPSAQYMAPRVREYFQGVKQLTFVLGEEEQDYSRSEERTMSIASSEQQPRRTGHRRFGTTVPHSPFAIGLGFAAAVAVASLMAPRDNRSPDQPANLDSPHPFLTQVKASVDPLTHWQPRSGQIRITLESTGNANLANSNLSVYFRWRTKSNTGEWTRTPNVHVVDLQNAQKLTVAAEVPELPSAPSNGVLGWISGNGNGVGEFLGLVPVAEVWVSARANGNAGDAALADVVESIGITNTWEALGAAL